MLGIKQEPLSIVEGMRFGRFVAQTPNGRNLNHAPLWRCICDCGAIRNVRRYDLLNGLSKSCGCLQRDTATTHGMSQSPEYKVWHGVLARIFTPNKRDRQNYGSRGISVSEEWATSFETFYRDMGPRPTPKHTVERIDNNGNYCKENCKWALPSEQHANKRTNVFVTFNGESLIIAEWARRLGGAPYLIQQRLDRGWSIERAVTTPPSKHGRRKLC